jgi:anti-sigma regulatory factor (Ser/Thr protein kinase)
MTSPEPRPVTGDRADTPGPAEIALDMAFDVDNLYGLRSAVAAHASNMGILLNDLLIVASELASNAIRHGGGRGRLRLWQSGDRLYCQVSDNGPGIADASVGLETPDPRQTGGRGVWIVRRLSEHVEIGRTPDGAVVTAIFPLP